MKSTNLLLLFSMVFLSNHPSRGREKVYTGSQHYISKTAAENKQFLSIELLGSTDVEYVQTKDGSSRVEVYSPDNLVDLVEVGISNQVLHVSLKPNAVIKGKRRPKVIAYSPAVSQVTVKGSGDVRFRNGLRNEKNTKTCLTLHVEGSGDIKLNGFECHILKIMVKGSGDIEVSGIRCTNVFATVRGSGDIDLEGACRFAQLEVYGSGDLDTEGLVADEVKALVKGSGDLECYAKENLEATVEGSGDLKYKGNPRNIIKNGQTKNIRRD